MLIGLVIIYILKVIDAPTWCFVLTWISIILAASKLLIRAYTYKKYEEIMDKIMCGRR